MCIQNSGLYGSLIGSNKNLCLPLFSKEIWISVFIVDSEVILPANFLMKPEA